MDILMGNYYQKRTLPTFPNFLIWKSAKVKQLEFLVLYLVAKLPLYFTHIYKLLVQIWNNMKSRWKSKMIDCTHWFVWNKKRIEHFYSMFWLFMQRVSKLIFCSPEWLWVYIAVDSCRILELLFYYIHLITFTFLKCPRKWNIIFIFYNVTWMTKLFGKNSVNFLLRAKLQVILLQWSLELHPFGFL